MSDFADLVSVAPKHDPGSCTRHPCRRCAGGHTPAPPDPVDHEVAPPEPPRPQVRGWKLHDLAGLLHRVADLVDDDGVTWRRLHSWETAPPVDTEERGGGDGGTSSDRDQRDRRENRAAAGWFAEYRDLLEQLVAPLRRLERLHQLAQVEDRTVHRTRTGDLDPMLAAEAAAAGYCASCWRYEQTCHPREKGPDGHFYHRQWCRRCARFHNEHGVLPPVELLRLWHGLGRRTWTTTEVETALAKSRGRKTP